MLKRHEIQVLRRAGHNASEVANLAGVSRRSVARVEAEVAVTHVDTAAEIERPGVGRPSTLSRSATWRWSCFRPNERCCRWSCCAARSSRATRAARAPSTRWWPRCARRPPGRWFASRGGGRANSRSTNSAKDVRFVDGTHQRIHFFASPLKYSRWSEVTLVPDERVETLVRALVEHFTAMGGVALLAVFDRPKTVAFAWRRDGVVTEWNPTFAGVALDLGLDRGLLAISAPTEGQCREPGRVGEGVLLQATALHRRRGSPRAARRVAPRRQLSATLAPHQPDATDAHR